MMAEISERHEVRVESGERTFVFVAEPHQGRLVLREEGADDEVCSLTLAEPEEITAFFDGLRRVLGSARGSATFLRDVRDDGLREEGLREGGLREQHSGGEGGTRRTPAPPRPVGAGPGEPSREASASNGSGGRAAPGDGDGADEPDRDEMISQARRRNPNAFKAWSKEEEVRLRERFEAGEPISDLARDFQRSPRAIQMRLTRLGLAEAG